MFTQKHNVKRIAYAASFGVDKWEFSLKETIACKECLKMFDGISVREHSGIKLCKEYLDVDAIEVLDPTLLLSKNEYLNLTSNIPVCKEKYLAAYILDRTEEKIYRNTANSQNYRTDRKGILGIQRCYTICTRMVSYVP